MELDFERCYRAVDSRDLRFDGWFYTGVTSTGIYCRPSCPATTPKRCNVRFFASAAAAQGAGLRACRRCRPDASPGSPEWDVRADVVGRAMRLIADGVVDRDGVSGLAGRLGYTERHLHRMLRAELGAGPLALARAQRAQTARLLIETTGLGLAEIAFAAGFGSVRQFNDTVRQVFALAPSELRAAARGRQPAPGSTGAISVRLAYRPPLHAAALLDFLARQAVAGVEEVRDGTYHRGLTLPHGPGEVALTPVAGHVAAEFRLTDLRDLAPAVARCRRLLDLDADPVAVDQTLAADPALAGLVAAEPGVRLPRTPDFQEALTRALSPTPTSVDHEAVVTGPGGSGRQLHDQPREPSVDGGWRELRRALLALPGMDEPAAGWVAMRGLGDPDVFLPTDPVVRRGARALGLPDDPTTLAAHARRWRPWRSYAVIRLWRAGT